MKFGVIVFPGSNCDHDAYHVISKHVGQPVDFIWHKETDLSGYDAVILPGGFSYGDYLRAGALAHFSPVMTAVKDFAARGKFVIPRLEAPIARTLDDIDLSLSRFLVEQPPNMSIVVRAALKAWILPIFTQFQSFELRRDLQSSECLR